MNEQEIESLVIERLKAKILNLDQQYSLNTQHISKEITSTEAEVKVLTRKISSAPKQNPILEFLYSNFFTSLVIFLGIILILQGQIIWTFVIGIIVSSLRFIVSYNPSTKTIKIRQKLEASQAELTIKLRNLKDSKDRLSLDLEHDKEELVNLSKYIINVLKARMQCKNLKTNLPYLILEEFNKIKARLSLGINYLEMPSFFTNAKFAVSQFKLSPDYQVCQLLSSYIEDTMTLYEYSIEAMRNKVYVTSDAWTTAESDIRLRAILKEQFSYTKTGEDRGQIVQTFWMLASQNVEKMQQILDTGDYMQFLNTRLNLSKV